MRYLVVAGARPVCAPPGRWRGERAGGGDLPDGAAAAVRQPGLRGGHAQEHLTAPPPRQQD